MLIKLLFLAFVLVFSLFLIRINQKNNHKLGRIKTLELYLKKNLNVQESILFLEIVRQLTLDLVKIKQKNSLPKIEKLTEDLVHFMLHIPRVDENEVSLDFLIQNISSIANSTEKIQAHLSLHLPTLKANIKYL